MVGRFGPICSYILSVLQPLTDLVNGGDTGRNRKSRDEFLRYLERDSCEIVENIVVRITILRDRYLYY